MRILFIGDIVGTPGVAHAISRIDDLRARLELDAVIANGENAGPDGLGLSPEALEALLPHVDVITGGNHSWDRDDAEIVLSHPRVLRPLNVTGGAVGQGSVRISIGDNTLTVLNLADNDAMADTARAPAVAQTPYEAFAAADLAGTVVVDLHANDVFAKQTFAHAVDGRVAAVLGTHTHEPTLTLHHLPQGTLLVSDVGMTGARGGVMGFDQQAWATGIKAGQAFRDMPLPRPVVGPCGMDGVVLHTEAGLTRTAERVS